MNTGCGAVGTAGCSDRFSAADPATEDGTEGGGGFILPELS